MPTRDFHRLRDSPDAYVSRSDFNRLLATVEALCRMQGAGDSGVTVDFLAGVPVIDLQINTLQGDYPIKTKGPKIQFGTVDPPPPVVNPVPVYGIVTPPATNYPLPQQGTIVVPNSPLYNFVGFNPIFPVGTVTNASPTYPIRITNGGGTGIGKVTTNTGADITLNPGQTIQIIKINGGTNGAQSGVFVQLYPSSLPVLVNVTWFATDQNPLDFTLGTPGGIDGANAPIQVVVAASAGLTIRSIIAQAAQTAHVMVQGGSFDITIANQDPGAKPDKLITSATYP